MFSFCKSEGGYSPFSMEYFKKHGQTLEKTWAEVGANVGMILFKPRRGFERSFS